MKILQTSGKIVSYERALQCAEDGETVWVSGHFDPLLAVHVRALEKATAPGKRLAVVISDPPNPLLPIAARARLVAALEMVDFVIPRETRASGSDTADLETRDQFFRHVRKRCEEAG